LDDLVQYDSPERRAKENIMFRRIPAAVAAFMLVLSFALVTPAAHAADVGAPVATTASSDVSTHVTTELTTFVKRVNSSKPDVRHRAWTQMTTNGQQVMFFPGDEQYFSPVKTKILQVGNVTINDNTGGFDVEVSLSGLWTAHGLYHGLLSFTGDYLIDNFTVIDPVVPEGMTGTTIQADLSTDAVTVDQVEITQTDVILLTITNSGAEFQLVELDRLYDGETTIDDLAYHMADRSQDEYASTGLVPGSTTTIGVAGVKPGIYVLSTIVAGTATTPQTIIASAVITITK
jgi:hypothetical protein